MYRKAKLKSTGEIIDVRTSMDHDGNTTWLESATDTEYYPSELEFIPVVIGRMQPTNSNAPFIPEDIVALDPLEMTYDAQNMTARFVQNMHIRITQEVVSAALRVATDKQLQDELKHRANLRKAMRGKILRCRDCKHCGEGLCYKGRSRYKTTVCFKQPKPQAGKDLYYATLLSRKACDMFELKDND